MDYSCPRCGKPVKRTFRTTGDSVSSLLYLAAGSFQCENCGTIPLSEFPEEVRRKARLSSALLILGAIGIIIACLLSFLYEHF